MMQQCWHLVPEKRPTFEILQHQLERMICSFTDYDRYLALLDEGAELSHEYEEVLESIAQAF